MPNILDLIFGWWTLIWIQLVREIQLKCKFRGFFLILDSWFRVLAQKVLGLARRAPPHLFMFAKGIWCKRPLLSVTLPCSGLVGSSGISLRNLSNFDLKWSTLSKVISLRYVGRRLNNLAPLTERLFSRALLTLSLIHISEPTRPY